MDKTFLEVLKHEGVVTIISNAKGNLCVTNTWNSYVKVKDNSLLIPAGGMHHLEENIQIDSEVLLTFGSKEVKGTVGPGAGFHVLGKAEFLTEGPEYEEMKAFKPFLTRVLKVTVEDIQQKI